MWFPAAILLAVFATAPQSRTDRLTVAAEQLLECERKISAAESLDDVLYVDVLVLLDLAVEAGPQNVHARALRSQMLLHLSFDGVDYDVCYLVDARKDAEFVVSHASSSAPKDVVTARRVLRGIEQIPADAIPDDPSSCNDQEEGKRGTRTKTRS